MNEDLMVKRNHSGNRPFSVFEHFTFKFDTACPYYGEQTSGIEIQIQ